MNFFLRVLYIDPMEVIVQKKETFFSAKRLTGLAVLLALVIVLQVFGGSIKIGTTPLSFVLVPIVVGGMLYGVAAGAFLGLAFGAVVLIYGIIGADPFTAILFNDHPFFTALLCLGKGAAAGGVPALAFKFLKGKNAYAGTFVAAATAPIVNTGLFVLGALAFLKDTLEANFVSGTSVVYFLIIVCAGVNFLVELTINLICAPSLYSAARVLTKGKF